MTSTSINSFLCSFFSLDARWKKEWLRPALALLHSVQIQVVRWFFRKKSYTEYFLYILRYLSTKILNFCLFNALTVTPA